MERPIPERNQTATNAGVNHHIYTPLTKESEPQLPLPTSRMYQPQNLKSWLTAILLGVVISVLLSSVAAAVVIKCLLSTNTIKGTLV